MGVSDHGKAEESSFSSKAASTSFGYGIWIASRGD